MLDSHSKEARRQCDVEGDSWGMCLCPTAEDIQKTYSAESTNLSIIWGMINGAQITDWVTELVTAYQTSQWATDIGEAQQRSERES